MQTLSIKSIKKIGIQNTIDLEVNHPEHNFYAEGIVCSNSHAVGYGSLTALTTYLKTNHPLEYFLSLLLMIHEKTKPIEEIGKIHNELKYFNIQLLPPNFILSDLDFKIEDKNIRFGLSSIKGFQEKTAQKIISFVGKYSNKFELFQGAEQSKLGIGALSSLIQAGTLDEHNSGKRSYSVFEAQLWNLLTDKEKIKCMELGQEFNFDLVQIIKHLITSKNEKGKPIINEKRASTLRKKYEPYWRICSINKKNEPLANYFYEKKLLGYSYSKKLIEIFEQEDRDFIPIYEASTELEDTVVNFVGEVIEVYKGTAKNAKKTKYLKTLVQDDSGQITCMLFNDNIDLHIEENKRTVEVGDIVEIKGKRKGDAIFAYYINIQTHKIYTKLSELTEEDLDKKVENLI